MKRVQADPRIYVAVRDKQMYTLEMGAKGGRYGVAISDKADRHQQTL